MNSYEIRRILTAIVTCIIIAFIFRYLWWVILLVLLAIIALIIYAYFRTRSYRDQLMNDTQDYIDVDRTIHQSYSTNKNRQDDIIDVEYQEHEIKSEEQHGEYNH
ncbi:MAG: hypothetical protein MR283_06865 [Erysipelotrichaceae bacterium]|nr:hypothetical protein [Erysipelotrichaceae bacterium]MDY6035474.1 hypothetical protein [Bulleidia sp.]